MYTLIFKFLFLSTFASLTSETSEPVDVSRRSSVPTVNTKGVVFHGNLSDGVESFFDLKFGQSTGGQNRFLNPKPFHYPHNTIFDASIPGVACPQQRVPITGLSVFSNVTAYSEDCLTLRVDRPANTLSDAKLPVMVYIYGGGFSSGQIYDRAYNPTGLVVSAAKKGIPVIYVAINYRVGIFGFAASPALQAEHSLNSGLLDQRLGLDWIQQNIKAFGGDPAHVTIFGESAGAYSVGMQVISYGGERPVPFKRVIMESGSASGQTGITAGVAFKHTAMMTSLTNCTSPDHRSKTELQCLRNLPLSDLLQTVIPFEFGINPFGAFNVWPPTAPSAFIPDAPSKLLHQGKFAKNIDLISGWCENDGSLFVTATVNLTTDNELLSYFKSTYPGLTKLSLKQMLLLYPLSSFSSDVTGTPTSQYFRAAQIDRDIHFTCPALLMTQAMANFSNTQTTTFIYTLNETLFANAFSESGHGYYGVSHLSDIPYVFNQASSYGASKAGLDLASRISGSWVAFARTGMSSSTESDGGLTIQNWKQSTQAGANGTMFSIDVLGGPRPGMTEIRSTGIGGPLQHENIALRCLFWNQETVLEELAT